MGDRYSIYVLFQEVSVEWGKRGRGRQTLSALLLQTSSRMDSDPSANPRNRSNSRIFPKGYSDSGHRKSPSSSSTSSSNSSSSSSRYFPDDSSTRSPLSPSTPLRLSSGVPFSWEKLPGIPKGQASSRRNSDSAGPLKLSKLLPLPPSAAPRKHGNPPEGSFRKKISPEWDPFVAALVECSKDEESHREDASSRGLWISTKVSRSISDHFGFIGLYASCKSSCAVDESIIYVPRPCRTTATLYGLIKYHHRGSADKWSPHHHPLPHCRHHPEALPDFPHTCFCFVVMFMWGKCDDMSCTTNHALFWSKLWVFL